MVRTYAYAQVRLDNDDTHGARMFTPTYSHECVHNAIRMELETVFYVDSSWELVLRNKPIARRLFSMVTLRCEDFQ